MLLNRLLLASIALTLVLCVCDGAPPQRISPPYVIGTAGACSFILVHHEVVISESFSGFIEAAANGNLVCDLGWWEDLRYALVVELTSLYPDVPSATIEQCSHELVDKLRSFAFSWGYTSCESLPEIGTEKRIVSHRFYFDWDRFVDFGRHFGTEG